MRDALGFAVDVDDVIAVIERSGTGARYVFGTLVEYDEPTGMFQMKYPNGKTSKWRQQYFHGIKKNEFNKVLLIKTAIEVENDKANQSWELQTMTDYYCNVCDETHDRFDANTLGMVCARCKQHTGNNNQGHYWAFCKVTRTKRQFHFCCPDDCELEN